MHFDNVAWLSVCLQTRAPVSEEGLKFFLFLTFLFLRSPAICLRLKDSSALSVYVMETDESQGKAERHLHFGSLAGVQQSPSDPHPESGGTLGCWQVSQGFPFQFCFLQKGSAGNQIKKWSKKDTPHSLATCNRQINNSLTCFSFLIFFLSTYSSNFDTIVEWKRDEKIVWLYFFTNYLLKSKMFLEKSQRWCKSPQLVRKLEGSCSKFTIVLFHMGVFSPWVSNIYTHFWQTPVSLSLWSFLQIRGHVFKTEDQNVRNISVELTKVTPKAHCSHPIYSVMKHNECTNLYME